VLAAGRELPAKDVMGALKSGDADMAELELRAGQDVSVVVEFRYAAARVHGLWYGIRTPDSPAAMLARAVKAAADADAVFLIVGETSDSSVESKDRPDTQLAAEQSALIDAVAKVNQRTVAVVNVGHAFDAEWGASVAALLVAWYPGEGFAPALASVLAGDREPGGRMPVSIARAERDYHGYALAPGGDGTLRYAEGTRIGYRGLIASGTPARHPLGSGFGYARFDWSDARIAGDAVSVLVRNTSPRAGADVVQVYRDAPESALIGFAKVALAAGEERRVTVALEPRMLRLWEDSGWTEMTGEIALRVARNAEDAGQTLILTR
jgi:beta-glucosidase